jgi:FtsH-binding integral membrane protein
MSTNSNWGDYAIPQEAGRRSIDIQAIMRLVYVWMGLGLLVTAGASWLTINTPFLYEARSSALVLVAVIAQFVMVIAIGAGLNRDWMTPNIAGILFFIYAAVTGFTLSVIFEIYAPTAITSALVTTTLLFAIMSIFGYTTTMDLTRWGTYLIIGLVGIIVASIVNIFLGSSTLAFAISIIGVLIFTGLTAYDTQKIRNYSETALVTGGSGNMILKFSIYGALILYLDFINLFLFLLRLFGGGSRR